MKLATTTEDFGNYFKDFSTNLQDIKKCLELFTETGFKYLDYSFYVDNRPDSLLLSDGWEETFKQVRAHADSLGLKFVQAHSPGGNPVDIDSPHYNNLLQSTIRSIKACKILGIDNIVVHAGYKENASKQEKFQLSKNFYSLLFPAMEETGVMVLTENGATANLPDGYFVFGTGEVISEFIDFIDHPLMGVCWDTGHANMMPNGQYDNIIALGDKLKAVHIADNLGEKDNHFAPYFGTLNMDEVMNALFDINFKGSFTLESTRLMIRANDWPAPRNKWHRDTRLYTVPLELKVEAEKLLYKIGKHILKSYNCFED